MTWGLRRVRTRRVALVAPPTLGPEQRRPREGSADPFGCEVTVVCFQGGEPTAVSGRYSPSLDIPAGASVSFSVAIENTDTCPMFAAAAAGMPSYG